MYGNLEHVGKIGTVHYFEIDIDVSDKSMFLETSFLANYQYICGDTAMINGVAYTLTATPSVDKLFSRDEIVTCCLDMKNKKIVCIDTHKASFDTFYVYNKFTDADPIENISTRSVTLFTKGFSVPKDLNGDDMITDVKIGTSLYVNALYSYEPEYGTGTNQRGLYSFSSTDIYSGNFELIIDGVSTFCSFDLTHRNESIVFEKTFQLKTGRHEIAIKLNSTDGSNFMAKLTANGVTAYVMGSNLIEAETMDILYIAMGEDENSLGAWAIAASNYDAEILKIPDYVVDTDIPVIGFLSYNGFSLSTLDSANNRPYLTVWNPEWGTGSDNDMKAQLNTKLNSSSYIQYSMSSSGYMTRLKKIVLGKNVQFAFYYDYWYQYSSGTLRNGYPIMDFSRCKAIKFIGDGNRNTGSSYGLRNNEYDDEMMNDKGEQDLVLNMDGDTAVINTLRIPVNRAPVTWPYAMNGYTPVTDLTAWANLEINGNTHRLIIGGGYDSYNTGRSFAHPLKYLHIDAENIIRVASITYANPLTVNTMPLTDEDYKDYLCRVTPGYHATTDCWYGSIADDLHLHTGSGSSGSVYIEMSLSNGSADEVTDVVYDIDGNYIFSGSDSVYMTLYSVIYDGTGSTASCQHSGSANLFINHTLTINIGGSLHKTFSYFSKPSSSYYIDMTAPWQVYTTNTSPSNSYRRWFSSSASTTRYSGDYYYSTSANTSDTGLYKLNTSTNTFYLYDNVYTQNLNNVKFRLNIENNFFAPNLYVYSTTSNTKGCRLFDPFFNDYTNDAEHKTIMRVKGNYLASPFFFAYSPNIQRIGTTSFSETTTSTTTSYSITVSRNSTTFSDGYFGTRTVNTNVKTEQLHPYEIHVDKNAYFTYGYSSNNGCGQVFFCDKIGFSMDAHCGSASTHIDSAINHFLMCPDYYISTNNGMINFNGFTDKSVLAQYAFANIIFPRNKIIDCTNVKWFSNYCFYGCICSGDFVWPTVDDPAECMSSYMFGYGEFATWGVLDDVYENFVLDTSQSSYAIPADVRCQHVYRLADIDFNAHIVGDLSTDVMFRKAHHGTDLSYDDIEIDDEFTHVIGELKKYIKWDDSLFMDGTNGIYRYDNKNGCGASIIFSSSRIGSYNPGQFCGKYTEASVDDMNTYAHNSVFTSSHLFCLYRNKPAIDAGLISFDDVVFPHYTLGTCIKHLGPGALLGKPVYCPIGDEANFQFREINLPEIVTIGDWAFTFAVVEDEEFNWTVSSRELVKRVICGPDTRWIGVNPDVNEFVIPTSNPYIIEENGYLYNAAKTVLFRAVNNNTIKSYTALDGPIELPSTLELILDGSMLKYDQRITRIDLTSDCFHANFTQVPPNLEYLRIPSDTTFAISALPSTCEFEIRNVGGSSPYYQPSEALASEVYSPTSAGYSCPTVTSLTTTGTLNNWSPNDSVAEPHIHTSDIYDSTRFSEPGTNAGKCPSNFYPKYNFIGAEDTSEDVRALAIKNNATLRQESGYGHKTSFVTQYTSNYNIVYFRENALGDTQINLDVKCTVLDYMKTIDILGIHAEMAHPFFAKANIKQYTIIENATTNYTVSADGLSLYYNGNLMRVANANPIDEYHVTTHMWPGAFYGCTIDKLYIDITSPDITVSNPLGSVNGTLRGTTYIPLEFCNLFAGATINKLYFNFADLPAMTMPVYSTVKDNILQQPFYKSKNGSVNEIHITNATQALITSMETDGGNVNISSGIPWFILSTLSPAAGQKYGVYGANDYAVPTVYLDGLPDAVLSVGSKNMGVGVKYNNGATLTSNINTYFLGSGTASLVDREQWIGSTENQIWFNNGANVVIDGDGKDLEFEYVVIGPNGAAISGNPDSISFKHLGRGNFSASDSYSSCNYKNRVPLYWENATSVTTDKAYTQMRIDSVEKFNKITWDLAEYNDVLWIDRGAFARGPESFDYTTDNNHPDALPYAYYYPEHGFRNYKKVERSYGSAVTLAMFSKLISDGLSSRTAMGPDANDFYVTYSLIHNTAASTLSWLHSTTIDSYFGGVLNLTLFYGDNPAVLTITPFTTINRNLCGDRVNWTSATSGDVANLPHISMCLTPLKNTDYTTFATTSDRASTMSVPAITTPNEFYDIWLDDAGFAPYTFDQVVLDSDYINDWRIFQRQKVVYDCRDATRTGEDSSTGIDWMYDVHEGFMQHGDRKHIWFKDIVVNKTPRYYDSYGDIQAEGNRINHAQGVNIANIQMLSPVALWSIYDAGKEGSSGCWAQLSSSSKYPWTSITYNDDLAVLTFNMFNIYSLKTRTVSSYYVVDMTDEMWGDLDHIHAYVNPNVNYLPIYDDSICVNSLTFGPGCRYGILTSTSSLFIRNWSLTCLDYVFITTDAVLSNSPIENMTIHNITPWWNNVTDIKKDVATENYDAAIKRFEHWFSYNETIKNVELIWDETALSTYLEFVDGLTTPEQTSDRQICYGLFSNSKYMESVKMNIPLSRTGDLFANAQLPESIIVKNADAIKIVGSGCFSHLKNNQNAFFDTTFCDFNGNVLDLRVLIEEARNQAFNGMYFDMDTITFPNLRLVNNAFYDVRGVSEMIFPSATSVTMTNPGSVAQIKVPTGCTVVVPSSVLVIFI